MASVAFPDALQTIEAGAFDGCTSLASVTAKLVSGSAADAFINETFVGQRLVTLVDSADVLVVGVGDFYDPANITEVSAFVQKAMEYSQDTKQKVRDAWAVNNGCE